MDSTPRFKTSLLEINLFLQLNFSWVYDPTHKYYDLTWNCTIFYLQDYKEWKRTLEPREEDVLATQMKLNAE